jgi:general secretion pathway protein H
MPISGSNPNLKRCQHQRGVSLFEMLLVIAIIAGLSAMTATTFAPVTGRARLKAEAAELSALLSQARTRAITQRAPTRVVIDAKRQTIITGTPAVQRELPPSLALSMDTQSDDGTAPVLDIVFLPEGSATGGTFELREGSQTIRFQIEWLTGRISTTAGFARGN